MYKKKTETSEELYGELGQALNFTRGDLEANRAGFITARQQRVLRRGLLPSFIFLVIMVIGLLLPAALLWTVFDPSANESPIIVWITIILMSLPFIVLVPLVIFFTLNSLRELARRRVVKYEGKVETGYNIHKSQDSYYLSFEDKTFSISKDAYHFINDNWHYSIFYLPEQNVILAIDEG